MDLEPPEAFIGEAELGLHSVGGAHIAQAHALLGRAHHAEPHEAGVARLLLQVRLKLAQLRKLRGRLGLEAVLPSLRARHA